MNGTSRIATIVVLSAIFVSTSTVASAVTLTGRVYEGENWVETNPIQGVTVTLYGAPDAGSQGWFVIDSWATDSAGLFVLDTSKHPFPVDFYNIVETDPAGYTSVGATSVGGKVMFPDLNWIQYSFADLSGTLTGNKFWDKGPGPGNRPPVALDDFYSVAAGQPVFYASPPGVLTNDSDPDGDTITAIWAGGPAHGTVTLQADGSFIYAPTAGFFGTDSFTYKANDGALNSNIATVTIEVLAKEVCTINVCKFQDNNGDGIWDAITEPPLANWKIFLDTNQNGQWDPGETFTLTDATGWSSFKVDCWSTYYVAEELKPGWQRTCPAAPPYPVKVETHHPVLPCEVRFGNRKVPCDFGDAPATYGTLEANGGAWHIIDDSLSLGPKVDAEADGKPTPDAQGDDNAGTDDEDGLVSVSHTPLTTGDRVDIAVYNTATTDQTVTVAGWIDFDRNGHFDHPADAIDGGLGTQVVLVPAKGQKVVFFFVHVPKNGVPGKTFARFRLYVPDPNPTALPIAIQPTGGGGRGEVEDYPVEIGGDMGDAPEGAVAYPSTGVIGAFPTCEAGPAGSYICHWRPGMLFFGPGGFDEETDGNGGQCGFPPYDQDEGFNDHEAGLTRPEPYTIDATGKVVPCPGGAGTALGKACAKAVWGSDIDINFSNVVVVGACVNVLIDWNQDGKWGGASPCPGGATAPEHVLVNQVVPVKLNTHLAAHIAPAASKQFQIGPNPGYVWARFTISDTPVPPDWDGSGTFEYGETEDYLLYVAPGEGGPSVPGEGERYLNLKWSQPPVEIDPQVEASPVFCGWDEPAFSVQTSARQSQWTMVADDFHCLGPIPVTSVRWWGSFAGWAEDELPSAAPTAFHIDIWASAPADTADSLGRPGKLVWAKTCDDWTWESAGYEKSLSGSETPVPPAGLVAHWKLDGDAKDSAGTSHGTVRGNPAWAAGRVGSALELDGLDDYVELPIGSLLSQLTDSTFAVWVNWSTGGGLWQRVFDFGTGTTVNMFLTPSAGAGGPLRFSITTGGSAAEQQVTAPAMLSGGWHHVAVVIDAAAHSMKLYLDGDVVAANTATTLTPSALGQTTRNWLGKSQYDGDAYYQGLIDDMQVYGRALSADEIKGLVVPLQQTNETCFEFNCKLAPDEWFRQDQFDTQGEIFWLSVTALYDGSSAGPNPWGWASRPITWRDGAVSFEWTGTQPRTGLVLDPKGMTEVHDSACGRGQAYDMAFELRTDPNWVKWDQPFTGIRDWPHYDDHASFASQTTSGMVTIVQRVADDWPGADPLKPVIAIAWHGSYVGHGYEACRCDPTVEPRRPDYFQLLIFRNAPVDSDSLLDQPGSVAWEYEAFDYDEVLVGYDRHPSGEPNEPVFRYSVRLPRDKWFWQGGNQQVYWLSVMAVYVARPDQIDYPWGWTDHKCTYGSPALALTGTGQVLQSKPLADPTGGPVDMSFTLYTTSEPRPIAHWGFDEATGNIAVDSIGGHNGTIHGATWAIGVVAGALRFDGGDYVEVSDEADFDITDALTVAAWVNLEAVNAEYIGIITKGDSTWRLSTLQAQRCFHFAVNDPQGAFHAVDGTTRVGLNEWHHVVGTYDGTSLRLYVDGVEEPGSPVVYTGPINDDDLPVWIGANAERSDRGFVGRIDEVLVYDRALTHAEVLDLMALK
jgi:hypothetical protein